MQNKMTERRNTLGRGAIASRLNSPIMQKVGDKLFFTLQNSLITKTIKAFSIAEAMIALLIGTIILGFSAPMISKQVKNNNLTNTQMQILQRQIDSLNSTLESSLDRLKIPQGTVAFFNLANCPDNTWTNVTSLGWGGYYFRVADASNARNAAQEQSIQSHSHNISMSLNLPNVGISWSGQGGGCPSGTCNHLTSITGSMHEVGTINAETAVEGGGETRPKTIPLTVCVKK